MKIPLRDIESIWPPLTEQHIARIAARRTDFTPEEVARLNIQLEDRIKLLLRPEVLGNQLQPLLERWVERAIRLALGRSACPEWKTWAHRWLSGEDRSAKAAAIARGVAKFFYDFECSWYASHAAHRVCDSDKHVTKDVAFALERASIIADHTSPFEAAESKARKQQLREILEVIG